MRPPGTSRGRSLFGVTTPGACCVAPLSVNRSNGWFCGVPLAKRCSRLRSGRAADWRGMPPSE